MVSRIDDAHRPEPRPRVAEDWRALLDRIPELGQYAAHYGSVQIDRAKLAARLALYKVFGIAFLALVGVVLLIGAIVLMLSGFAAGMRALFASQPWLGELLAGAVIILALVLVIGVAQRKFDKRSFTRTLRKYAERRAKERARFGRCVGDTSELDTHG